MFKEFDSAETIASFLPDVRCVFTRSEGDLFTHGSLAVSFVAHAVERLPKTSCLRWVGLTLKECSKKERRHPSSLSVGEVSLSPNGIGTTSELRTSVILSNVLFT